MWLIAVLLLLPFIYVLATVSAPFIFVFGRSIHFAEKLYYTFGGVAAWAFYILIIVLVVFCGKSKWFFWLGLLPVLLFASALGGWN
jgi:lipopolysaccharide export LptBFGC system permease protein LptF